MREAEFRVWYLRQGWSEKSFGSDRARLLRLERALPAYDLADTDLDSAYRRDRLVGVIAALQRNIANLPDQIPPLDLVPRSTNYAERLNTALGCVQAYKRFCEEGAAPQSQADQIRAFVIRSYVDPSRNRGEASVEIVSGDVHKAMGLQNKMPAVCAVLEAPAFAAQAKVKLLDRHSPIGSDKPSSTIRYRFALEGNPMLDMVALERLKQAFLSLHPDFTNFADTPSFASNEGDYKQALIDEAQRLLAAMQDRPDAELGAALIELLAGRTQLFCNLIDWRAQKVVDNAEEAQPGLVSSAAGRLARAEDATDGIMAFLDTVWPHMRGDLPSNPYAESRMFPTMLRALVDPETVLAIRSMPTDNAARALLGRPAFANAPLSREEQQTVTAMACEMMRVMDEEWGWAPRHLWDVQGFIWETCQKRLPDQTEPAIEKQPASEKAKPAMPQPTNLILYGPPGTGKTYRTAAEAVRLCGEAVPDDREELMELYRSLSRKGRIGFVTFHQNFSYEDFVEGLRPQQAETDEQVEGGGTGFSLVPRDGVFKEMAKVAGENRGRALTQDLPPFDGSRKIFKMSLGRSWASEDDAIYQGALDGGYVVLGWGGDVDWSAPEYDDWEAIKRRWRQDHPDAHGNDPNMSQIYTFRANMEVGSLIVISDGNMKFRAIAEVTGDYRFEQGPGGEYNHRRDVRWLWHSDESLPRERIYRKQLSQVSAYQMQSRQVVWDALEQIVASGGDAVATSGEPEPYVLVIDEINRANVSKVFGELITLLEPDKRAGQENALTVKLPYSGDDFSVPSNLHIIGTMNTADRSIALLDTALRRRFRFEEMAPDTSVPAFGQAEADTGLPLAAVLNAMNRRIEYLVDRDHRIGHAFFIGCETKRQVDAVMRDKVIPLLQEYFFDDWNRLAAVLGEKDKGGNFLSCETIEDPLGEGDPMKSWRVRKDFDEGAYHRLVSGKAAPAPDAADPEVDPA